MVDLVAQGLVKNDPMVIASRVDLIARAGMRDWLVLLQPTYSVPSVCRRGGWWFVHSPMDRQV